MAYEVMGIAALKNRINSVAGFGRAVDCGLVEIIHDAAMHVEMHGNTECIGIVVRKAPRAYAEHVRKAVAALFDGALRPNAHGTYSYVRRNDGVLSARLEAMRGVIAAHGGVTSRGMTRLVDAWCADNARRAAEIKAASDDAAGTTSDEGEGTGNIGVRKPLGGKRNSRPWILSEKLGALLDSAAAHGSSADDVLDCLKAIVSNMRAAIEQAEAKARAAKEAVDPEAEAVEAEAVEAEAVEAEAVEAEAVEAEAVEPAKAEPPKTRKPRTRKATKAPEAVAIAA